MKRITAVSLAVLTVVGAGAWERSRADLERSASDILGKGKSEISCLLEKDMLSVYGGKDGGFVVVSRSSASSPVIGYSDTRFEGEALPEGFIWWLDQADRVLRGKEKILSVGNAPESEIAPMLKTFWEQDRPYNDLCPSLGGFWGSTPQTGCVATAMAQVLKYFSYPPKGTGKGYYSIDGQNYTSVNINTEYKWDKMLDRYRTGYSDEEAKAVAELMRDCGYASKMVYTAQGSGANLYDAAYGISHNMQYDSLALRVRTRAYYTDSEWFDMIRKELEGSRPVLYAATDPQRLAHSFVLDGMDNRGFVHVNWGWGGTANGYFDVTLVGGGLDPSYMDPYTGSDIKYNFSEEQLMVIGFRPDPVPAEDEKYESFFGGYDYPTLSFQDDSLMISSIPVFNFSHLDFQGLLGLVIEGEDGHAVVQPFFYSAWEDGATIPVIGGLIYPEEYYPSATLNDTDGTTPRPDGKYKFYFVSWSEQEMKAGGDPQMFHYPVLLDPDKKSSYAIWEAEKKNGHWVESSLHRIGSTTGVETVLSDKSVSDGVWSLDGIRLGDDMESLRTKGRPVIVISEGKASKTIIR